MVFPHVRHQVGAIHHATGTLREVEQECEFGGGERDLARAATHEVSFTVDHQITDDDDRRERVHAAARERAESGQQFAEVEWLGEIVVGAGIEPSDPVLNGVERREHQNRHPIAAGTDGAADIDTAHAGQQHIEDHGVIRTGFRECEGVRTGRGLLHLVGGFPQSPDDGGAERTVVFGEKQAHHRKLRRGAPRAEVG